MTEPCLLAVDDNPDNLFVLRELVAAGVPGCTVLTASSAAEGLKLAAEKPIDGALIDVQMSGMDGIEMCRRLKADEETAWIPVLLLTAHEATAELRARGLDAGADDFISKPIDNIELAARIKVMLRIRRAENEQRAVNARLEELVAQRTHRLRVSEEKLRVLFENTPDTIMTVGRDATISYINHASPELADRAVIGADSVELLQPADRGRYRDALGRAFEAGEDDQFEHQSPDGHWYSARVVPIQRNGQVAAAMVIATDITERRQAEQEKEGLEEQLHQSQKMEAIGQLAGGIAHDFNNLLTAILGNAQMLKMTLDASSSELSMVGQIENASKRAADLTRQLLAFARKERLQSARIDVHDVIRDVVELLTHSIDRRITLKQDLRADLSVVVGDPSQLQNALLNLGVNARDAMPDGGELTFATKTVLLDEDYCRLHPYEIPPGRYLSVSVTDTGVGMDPETRKHIFEPFFTTKGVGKGTGLGLASVYGCVRNHRGSIEVSSEVGRESTFRVLLPAAEGDEEVVRIARNTKPIRGTGNILLVDDEEVVRNYAASALRDLGYVVTTCADGAEAVRCYRQHHHEIDLVLLDLIMPRMDGREAFRRMKDINPDVRAMLSSGYGDSGTSGGWQAEGILGFLAKPYQIGQLSQMVARHIRA